MAFPSAVRSAGLILLLLALSGPGASAEVRLTERDARVLRSLSISAIDDLQATAPSNRYAESAAARDLGEKLFFDPRLSANGKIACSSCHQPDRYFTDGLTRSRGIDETLRNAPTIVGTGYLSWFYWDGRRDSLWSQALIPIEATAEMGGSRVEALRLLLNDEDYLALYEQTFGPVPPRLNMSELPERASPLGDETARRAWDRIPQAQRESINRIYANVGKAIAAYERTLLPRRSRFDAFADTVGDPGTGTSQAVLSDDEIAGALLFINSERTQCLECHNGPLLTNGGFHNIGSGNFTGKRLDFGRVYGLRMALMDEFNCLGPYSDAQPRECSELIFLNSDSHIPLEGAFKVPGLRNVSSTAPYFHDGRFETLEQVVDYYRTAAASLAPGTHELRALEISDLEAGQLAAFLRSLGSE